MAECVVAALDIGTSSVRATLFDLQGAAVPGALSHRTHQPQATADGGSTLDADDLVATAITCLQEVMSGHDLEVVGVAVATFWHSFLGIDEHRQACTPVYLWSDTRSASQMETLRSSLDERAVHARTGCLFHTSYLPARLLWLSHTRPDLIQKASAWMSPGEYLQFRLFGERACSFSMASGTGLLNQRTLDWDQELLAFLKVPAEKLSPLVDSSHSSRGMKQPFAGQLPALANVPWFPALGDGACSNVGCGAAGSGRMALMVGTSGAMRLLGEAENDPPWGLWKYRLDRRRSLIGGALSNGGAVYSWLLETLRLPVAHELEEVLSKSVPGDHGLTVLPFLLGERSPDWYAHATGAILRLTAATTPLQIFQASLEAVTLRFMRVHSLLAPLADAGHHVIGTGGGLVHSPAWSQMMADALGRPLELPPVDEATSRGAALMALEGLGQIPDVNAAPAPAGSTLAPDEKRHNLYAQTLTTHQAMTERWVSLRSEQP